MLDGVERAAEKRADKRAAKTKREPGLKYSKRGKVSSQPGQVSKAALKRIREATAASKAVEEVDEQRAAEKRQEYQRAQSRGIPQAVTDRMLKRISIFSGVPLLLGFTTGPTFPRPQGVRPRRCRPVAVLLRVHRHLRRGARGHHLRRHGASWEPARGGHVLGRRRDSSQHPRALAERRGEGGGEGRKRFPDEWDDGEP